MFYKWAIKNKLVKENPFDDLKKKRVSKAAEIVFLTRAERDQVTAALSGEIYALPVWIALYAGLRRGEIIRLRWEDIDFAGRWIHMKKTKTDRPRHVPISPTLFTILKKFAKNSGYVAAHWQNAKVSAEIKADSDIVALAKKKPKLSTKIKWNVFRHTFASLLAQTGKVTIDQIYAMMGNTPEVCRRHYAHLIPNAAENTSIHLID